MHDLEQQLKIKGVDKSKWALVLRCKVPDLDLTIDPTVGRDYEKLRDNILNEYGLDDPWGVILTRIMGYQL